MRDNEHEWRIRHTREMHKQNTVRYCKGRVLSVGIPYVELRIHAQREKRQMATVWGRYGNHLAPYKNSGDVIGAKRIRQQCWELGHTGMGRWVGFDLEKFDWTAPYGTGEKSDMLIRFASNIKNAYFDFKISMDVCFTNNPFGGAYICKKTTGSDFTWSECADTNETFVTEFNYTCERRPDGTRVIDRLSDDSYLVFRTRTTVDSSGNLASAHYGVISGGWLFGSETMRVGDACFNSKENDARIEDGYYLRKDVKEHLDFGH